MEKQSALKKEHIFITGASGKIGQKLVSALLKKNYQIIGLVRQKAKLPLKHPNLELIEADILEVKKYLSQIRKCDYVYHLAAYQDPADPEEKEFVRVNVEGTRSILTAVVNSAVKKVFYLSTIMVFKLGGEKKIDEKSAKKTSAEGNHYIETKISALGIIQELKTKIPLITFYPTIVIDLEEIKGRGAKPGFAWGRFFWELLGGGIPGGLMCLVGNKNRMMNYILMNNLVAALVAAIKKGKPGEDYILGGENISVENYRRAALKIKGRPFLPLRIPLSFLKLTALVKIPQINLISSIVKNPPENMRISSNKAVANLGLAISRLGDYQR